MVGDIRRTVEQEFQSQQLVRYFRETRGWGQKAMEWLEGGISTHWLMRGAPVAARVVAMKYLYAMIWTDDVQSKRASKETTDIHRLALARCSLCGQDTTSTGGQANGWHLYAECKDGRAVALRRELMTEVTTTLRKHILDPWLRSCMHLPWLLDDEGCWHKLGSVQDMAEAIGKTNEQEQEQLAELGEALSVGKLRWEEQRRFAGKGMLGQAWTKWLVSKGVEPDRVRDLVKKLFRQASSHGVLMVEVFYKVRSSADEDRTDAVLGVSKEADELIQQALERYVKKDLREEQEAKLLTKGWKYKVDWAIKWMTKGGETWTGPGDHTQETEGKSKADGSTHGPLTGHLDECVNGAPEKAQSEAEEQWLASRQGVNAADAP